MKIIPVILSGGSGTRLWPLSRKQYPKQYLPLLGDKTMLQATILRLSGLDNIAKPIIVCNADHRFLVAEQCQQINIIDPTILLEPIGRNTAPAIAAAALQAGKTNKNAILLVLSADHSIGDITAFHQAIIVANQQAEKGKLATFGIVPTDANTGYGYIKSSADNVEGAYKVKAFIEKPDLKTAQSYLAQGHYLWNSGMFMFQINTFIDELTAYAPDIMQSVTHCLDKSKQEFGFIYLESKHFKSCASNSIDYALMEKSNNVVVVPLDAQWSDIGTWSSLDDISPKDPQGNVIQGDVFTQETSNTYIHATHHIVATIGVKDLIIVDTADATLITTKNKSQQITALVHQLQQQNKPELLNHRKVYRPWGWYDSIETGLHFQVKRLHINPNARLSLQKHYKRAEHWVVVSGVATVVNGDDKLSLTKGESTYIPIGTKHSLANQTDVELEIIEVQSGVYLGEDDIERFEDIYGRVEK